IYDKTAGNGSSAAEVLEEVVDTFARCLINTATLLAPGRIVLYGPMFRSEKLRNDLRSCCFSYDPSMKESLFTYSTLADREDYIGPAADLVRKKLLSENI
ncbi:MAG: hypothetical protein ACI4CS_07950, partial [Candidatus Weimeria sp.]